MASTDDFLYHWTGDSTGGTSESSTFEDVTPNAHSVAIKARWPYFFFLLLLLAAIFCNVVVITSVFFYEKLHGLFYYGIASLSAGHIVYMVLVAPFLIARSILGKLRLLIVVSCVVRIPYFCNLYWIKISIKSKTDKPILHEYIYIVWYIRP